MRFCWALEGDPHEVPGFHFHVPIGGAKLEGCPVSPWNEYEFMLLHGAFSNTPLDRDSIAQSTLDIAKRSRTNHFPWTGQFSPQFAEAVLSAYGPADGVVLDPFVGSGTSLVEAARLGLAANGADLNPAALALARVYELVNLERQDRALVLGEMEGALAEGIGPPHGPLFSPASEPKSYRANIEATLVRVWRDARHEPAWARVQGTGYGLLQR